MNLRVLAVFWFGTDVREGFQPLLTTGVNRAAHGNAAACLTQCCKEIAGSEDPGGDGGAGGRGQTGRGGRAPHRGRKRTAAQPTARRAGSFPPLRQPAICSVVYPSASRSTTKVFKWPARGPHRPSSSCCKSSRATCTDGIHIEVNRIGAWRGLRWPHRHG
jgi:hypothetical protein